MRTTFLAIVLLSAVSLAEAQLLTTPTPPSPAPPPATPTTPEHPLKWDAHAKTEKPHLGDGEAAFTFTVINEGTVAVAINAAHSSCGCTVAKLPSEPWILKPGERGSLTAKMDLAGKRGVVTKTITLDTSAGRQLLTVTSDIQPPAPGSMPSVGERESNQMTAMADPQAIFRGDCAKCHVAPTVGRRGRDLFAAACGICHESEHRASMVPDLARVNSAGGAGYWRHAITQGKPGTLMPAFAKQHGGILTDAEIDSLVQYLVRNYPAKPSAD